MHFVKLVLIFYGLTLVDSTFILSKIKGNEQPIQFFNDAKYRKDNYLLSDPNEQEYNPNLQEVILDTLPNSGWDGKPYKTQGWDDNQQFIYNSKGKQDNDPFDSKKIYQHKSVDWHPQEARELILSDQINPEEIPLRKDCNDHLFLNTEDANEKSPARRIGNKNEPNINTPDESPVYTRKSFLGELERRNLKPIYQRELDLKPAEGPINGRLIPMALNRRNKPTVPDIWRNYNIHKKPRTDDIDNAVNTVPYEFLFSHNLTKDNPKNMNNFKTFDLYSKLPGSEVGSEGLKTNTAGLNNSTDPLNIVAVPNMSTLRKIPETQNKNINDLTIDEFPERPNFNVKKDAPKLDDNKFEVLLHQLMQKEQQNRDDIPASILYHDPAKKIPSINPGVSNSNTLLYKPNSDNQLSDQFRRHSIKFIGNTRLDEIKRFDENNECPSFENKNGIVLQHLNDLFSDLSTCECIKYILDEFYKNIFGGC